MRKKLLSLAALCLGLAAPLAAEPAEDALAVEVLPGWRLADGTHVAGIRLRLAPGWKTYWRAPGDAGIPPSFDWQGSRNVGSVQLGWPTPHVFEQNGMRSVGYSGDVVWPVIIQPARPGQPVALSAEIDLGVCKDVCVPRMVQFRAELPAGGTRPDPRIAAALAEQPYSRAEAGVKSATCALAPDAEGVKITATIRMPSTGAGEAAVIEAGNPNIWVSEPEIRRSGDTLVATARMEHVAGGPLAIDREALRITVIGGSYAVDIPGCPAG
ncbi:protein-disulfide reductase DsbD domain-containing protein [Mesobacterium pallidum]|uniref:protein-disulfide reductase DsbD domain-containing protein n=1 Tax=Mesobacterium pallidum TaxID=2872037 RepID=UPI001EE1FA7D|nr:protein-disulfide reductase DsbD domain-containing protein [Mesobacterium pallidum]